MTHTNNGYTLHRLIRIFLFALFVGLIGQISKKLFQICFCSDTIDRHNFYHSAIQFTIPDITLRERLNLQRRNQQIAGFHRVTEKVVIVDIINLKASIFDLTRRFHTGLPIFQLFSY